MLCLPLEGRAGDEGTQQCPSRCSSLLLSVSADVRSPDDGILLLKGWTQQNGLTLQQSRKRKQGAFAGVSQRGRRAGGGEVGHELILMLVKVSTNNFLIHTSTG